MGSSTASNDYVPLQLSDKSLRLKLLVGAIGVLLLTLSSYIEVPMVPVPMTMQTYAVLLVAVLCGARFGTAIVLGWLGLAAVGLPLLSGGTGGIERFAGPTAGYLFAFPIAAAVTGWLAERDWTAGRWLKALAALIIGHAICLLFGTAWLAWTIGGARALQVGLLPFLSGAVLKSVLVVATVELVRRR